MAAESLPGLFKAFVNAVHTRKDDTKWVILVKGDECGCLSVSELPNETFRGQLETTLDEHGDKFFFVVEERDEALHVLAYPKDRVYRETAQALLADRVEEVPSADEDARQDAA